MHAITRHLTTILAAAAVALGAVGPAAGANEFIAGVTDSSTGVLREREARNDSRFVPGVTDSGTGVLRERERRLAPPPSVGDSGLDPGPAAIAAGAALAAAALAGALVLAGGARGRHIPA